MLCNVDRRPTDIPLHPPRPLAVLDDDLVGNVTVGGDFCLDLVTGGTLEVWAAPLTGARWAVALFNRSPADDTITVEWGVLSMPGGAAPPPTASFTVRDVWAGVNLGPFNASYSAPVVSRGVALLILTPSS